MRFSALPFLALCSTLTTAINLKGPTINSTLTKGSSYGLTWSSVDTDPTTFSIYLVNFVNWPPFYTLLKQNVETASGQATVRVPCSVDTSYGFQFNANNGTNLYVIYAQTPKFLVGASPSNCTDSASSSLGSQASMCPPAATVTVTMRANGSYATTSAGSSVTAAMSMMS